MRTRLKLRREEYDRGILCPLCQYHVSVAIFFDKVGFSAHLSPYAKSLLRFSSLMILETVKLTE